MSAVEYRLALFPYSEYCSYRYRGWKSMRHCPWISSGEIMFRLLSVVFQQAHIGWRLISVTTVAILNVGHISASRSIQGISHTMILSNMIYLSRSILGCITSFIADCRLNCRFHVGVRYGSWRMVVNGVSFVRWRHINTKSYKLNKWLLWLPGNITHKMWRFCQLLLMWQAIVVGFSN